MALRPTYSHVQCRRGGQSRARSRLRPRSEAPIHDFPAVSDLVMLALASGRERTDDKSTDCSVPPDWASPTVTSSRQEQQRTNWPRLDSRLQPVSAAPLPRRHGLVLIGAQSHLANERSRAYRAALSSSSASSRGLLTIGQWPESMSTNDTFVACSSSGTSPPSIHALACSGVNSGHTRSVGTA